MGSLDTQIRRSEYILLNQVPADLPTRPPQNCVPDFVKTRNLYRPQQLELPPRPPVQYHPRRHSRVDRIPYENGPCFIDKDTSVHEVGDPIAAVNASFSSNMYCRNLYYDDRSPRAPLQHPIENQSFHGTPREAEWAPLYKRSGFYSDRKSSCRSADHLISVDHRLPAYSSSMKDVSTIDVRNPAYSLVDLGNAIDDHRRQSHSPREHVMVELMKSSYALPEHVAVNEQMQLAVSSVDHVSILGEYGLHRVNAWPGDRSSSGSNSYGGLVHNPPSTGLQRGSSGSSFADSLYSWDFTPTNRSPSVSPNVGDSAFNAFDDEGCKYDDTRQSGESEKNWARQTEERYNLQLTLALRLTAEASLAENLQFLGRHVQATPNISSTCSAKKSAVALSHRFWVNSSLSADVCIGTSAAPTYLPAHCFEIQDSGGKTRSFNLIDGGVAANDPTLLAINHAVQEAHIRNQNPPLSKPSIDYWPLEQVSQALDLKENESSKFLVLSLGTGHKVAGYKATDAAKWGLLEWLTKDGKAPLIDIFMQSSADMVDIHAYVLFNAFNKHTYLRIQEPELSDDRSSMDLSTEENLNGLKMIGSELLDKAVSSVNIQTGHYEKVPGENAETNREVLTR